VDDFSQTPINAYYKGIPIANLQKINVQHTASNIWGILHTSKRSGIGSIWLHQLDSPEAPRRAKRRFTKPYYPSGKPEGVECHRSGTSTPRLAKTSDVEAGGRFNIPGTAIGYGRGTCVAGMSKSVPTVIRL